MRRRLSVLTMMLALVPFGGGAAAQAPSLRSVMREKLTNTQQLLEGVITSNYTIVDKYGERLGQISYTEVASWQSNAQPEYLKQASAFVNAVQGIRQATRRRDSDAVADEYARMVNACVSCHKYVHQVKPIRLGAK